MSPPFFGELLAYVKGVGGYRSAHEKGGRTKSVMVIPAKRASESVSVCYASPQKTSFQAPINPMTSKGLAP